MTANTNPEDRLLTPGEVGAMLAIRPQTLSNWRALGQGPAFIRIGRSVRYRRSAVDAWLAECEQQTQQAAA